jgi:hypothetical protein
MTVSLAFIQSIYQLHTEAAGAVQAVVVRPSDTPGLFAAIVAGDQEAYRLGVAISAAVDRVGKGPKRKRMICAACQRRLEGTGYALVVVSPLCDDPSRAVTLGVCTGCAVEPADIKERCTTALRMIWPGYRPIVITDHVGGRA